MALTGPKKDLFGDIAVSKGLLAWAQVRDALKRQAEYKQKGIPMRIGEVCVEMGVLTQAQCGDILTTQREYRKQTRFEVRQIPNFDLDDSEEGEIFRLGRYRLEKRLGGAMGMVYKGTDEQTKTTVALKILPKHLAHDTSFLERFKREVKATCVLYHPNIIHIYDTGVEQGIFYLATEFVDGESLNQRIGREGFIAERDGLRIGREVARALAHAHARNVLHRDVKPDNIMLGRGGEIKLADLGLAKFLRDEQPITAEGIAVGTPHYISPEQARALKDVDHRSDLYSLGATLFHAFTGRLPYEGDNGAEVMKRHVFEPVPDPLSAKATLSKPTAEMLMKLMAKDPADRFQTADELAQHIDKLLQAVDALHAQALQSVGRKTALVRKPFSDGKK
jgi:eukaryotic-like serine/threonine-protein kinase